MTWFCMVVRGRDKKNCRGEKGDEMKGERAEKITRFMEVSRCPTPGSGY